MGSFVHRALPLLSFAILCYFLTGTVSSIMNVSVGMLETERGWDATLLSGSMSVAALVNVVTGFIAGRMNSNGSARVSCAVWGMLYIVGVLSMGVAPQMGLFIVSMVLANAASSALGYSTVPVLITNWFPMRKGTVQGFVSVGILLSSLSAVMYTAAVRYVGVELATVPFAAVGGIALVILHVWVVDRPEQVGLAPDTMERIDASMALSCDGSIAIEEGRAPIGSNQMRAWLSNPSFVGISLALGVQLLFCGGIMVQVVPRLMEIGFSLDEASSALIATSLCACAGSFAFGYIGDRWGVNVGVRLSFFVGACAGVMNLSDSRMIVLASLVLIGIVVGCSDSWPVGVCAEFFGREGFSNAFGVMLPIIQLVGAAGPAAFAFVAAQTGSYDWSYLCASILLIVGLIVYSVLSKRLTRTRVP